MTIFPGAARPPYIPNIMFDVPAGLAVANAPAAPGIELYATNTSTRYVVDWSSVSQAITKTRIQVVAKNSTTGTVNVKIRDITNSTDIVTVAITGATAQLVAGTWTTFTQPTSANVTYAVFVQGDGAMDPTIYSVLWEWSS